MLLMIDNYDSFTYNLVQYFGELGQEVKVFRNDKISLDEIRELNPEFIIVSPGPCSPEKAGISVEVIREFTGKIPIMGVCLGHQSIGYAFGAEIVRSPLIMHGKASPVRHDGKTIFKGVESPFAAGRYHSLVIESSTLTDEFEVSAQTEDGEIMAIRHKEKELEGIQFHPESILTPAGKKILKNFLELYRNKNSQ